MMTDNELFIQACQTNVKTLINSANKLAQTSQNLENQFKQNSQNLDSKIKESFKVQIENLKPDIDKAITAYEELMKEINKNI